VPKGDIERENHSLLERQRQFRAAADVVVEAWMAFPEVRAIAIIGSVAVPLWKEVLRFREYRRRGIELWHECHDLDLAVWIESQDRLGELRRARDHAVKNGLRGRDRPLCRRPPSGRFLVRAGHQPLSRAAMFVRPMSQGQARLLEARLRRCSYQQGHPRI
jgi:hypothetical protein